MTSVLTRQPPRPSTGPVSIAVLVIGAAAVAAVSALLLSSLRTPSRVAELTIENPHEWNVRVDVTESARNGWLGVGDLDRRSTQTFYDVIDQGEQWVFRFAYGGVGGGEVVVDRARLEQDGWKLAVPQDFAERMRQARMEPSG